MQKINNWLELKFAQYGMLTTSGKIFIWLFGFLTLFTIELAIAVICYECHIPMVNGWTNEIVLKP
jgi:hypothetical protein